MLILLSVIHYLFFGYTILLMARIIGSWFPSFAHSKWMRFVAFYTNPYLNLFRKIIPPLGSLDLSPILAFFALQILENFIIRLLL
ncbi:MAG: YggT family protein [Chlamydiae bacterium]|nr:YggT family protein [Chlamydiota bacterium]